MSNEQKSTETTNAVGLDFKAILAHPVSVAKPSEPEPEVAEPKRRGRPPKNKEAEPDGMIIQQNTTATNMFSTNQPYINSYGETMKQLDAVGSQAAIMATDLKAQFDSIKKSTTIKGKFSYMSEIGSTINSLIGTELQCIREKAKIVTDCHNFEMKRSQAQKQAEAAVPDNKYIADLYQAYINMPTAQQVPNNPLQMTSAHAINNPQYQFVPSSDDTEDFMNFHNNITPEQNRMILGDNPNIETIVCYNPSTDEKYFAVIDTTTNQLVPNYPLPDEIMMHGMTINQITMRAANPNYGMDWRLVIVGTETANF